MRKLGCCLAGTIAMLSVFCGVAGAATLGTTTQPSGSTGATCLGPAIVGQIQSDPGTPYVVPAGGGQITQWSTNTTGDTAGAPITMVVLRPTGSTGDYTVADVDSESLPNPLPASGVASFTPPTPITVNGGDVLGLYSSATGASTPTCFWVGGSTPTDAIAARLDDATAPAAGQSVSVSVQEAQIEINLAVTLVQSEDVGVSTTAGPADAAAGRPAVLSSTVTNAGLGDDPITFVDHVPSGLTVTAAVAGQGTCSTSVQTVTCTIAVSAGQSASVVVIVTPAAAGSYANTVSVSASLQDPNAANNTASATLVASAPAPTPKCVVPKLKNVSSKLAGTVLKDLGCKVKTSKAHSKSVRKGNVIKTKPGAGTHPFGTTVKVQVSSGRARKKHQTRH